VNLNEPVRRWLFNLLDGLAVDLKPLGAAAGHYNSLLC